MHLNAASPEPLYAQLRDLLRERIFSHDLRTGDRLPSEDQLIEHYGVSRITVRRALADLVGEGYLIKHSGKGTFVASELPHVTGLQKVAAKFTQNNDVQSFTEACAANGQRAGAKLISCTELLGFDEERDFFGFGSEGMLICVKRVRCANDVPVMVEENYFATQPYHFLLSADFDDTSLFRLIREAGFGEPMLREPCQLDIEKASATSAQLLEVPVSEPLFCLRGRYFDQSGQAMYLGNQHIVGSRYTFRI
ncbi:GntR family transcriptional regulator [Collinsella sp. zg1085]|uniref:GntR family transcriptional regulator n=1 Tax=Collinsella sp. zg1085 TaxID=2844380 RepID=UPI001C0AB0E6|nr:GntR family transcriptional regulator [Collinsella sp. zg1085]QWT18021.1 GntR family transcriptional regulator [Collinsella sp. zg1085]